MSMMSSGRIVNQSTIQPVNAQRTAPTSASHGARGFEDVLRQRLKPGQVHISAHASARLRNAGVNVDVRFEQRLQSAVDKAAAKGSRSSLVLLDELALVVSVQNRTVITAVDSGRMQDSVFTNIDSAVIS